MAIYALVSRPTTTSIITKETGCSWLLAKGVRGSACADDCPLGGQFFVIFVTREQSSVSSFQGAAALDSSCNVVRFSQIVILSDWIVHHGPPRQHIAIEGSVSSSPGRADIVLLFSTPP